MQWRAVDRNHGRGPSALRRINPKDRVVVLSILSSRIPAASDRGKERGMGRKGGKPTGKHWIGRSFRKIYVKRGTVARWFPLECIRLDGRVSGSRRVGRERDGKDGEDVSRPLRVFPLRQRVKKKGWEGKIQVPMARQP